MGDKNSGTRQFFKMHTVLTRANALAAYTMSVLAGLTAICALSTLFNPYLAPSNINTVKVVVKHVPDYSASREKNDLGFLTFDLHADLTPLFNWNVNQVFLWDKIVKRGENAFLDYRSMNTKYYFWDDGNGLKGHKNVTMTLSWNVIPNAGILPRISSTGSHSFAFPAEYTTARVI